MSDTITPLMKMTIPLGGQVIELQQFDHASGGMSLLRTRIREKADSPYLKSILTQQKFGVKHFCHGPQVSPM